MARAHLVYQVALVKRVSWVMLFCLIPKKEEVHLVRVVILDCLVQWAIEDCLEIWDQMACLEFLDLLGFLVKKELLAYLASVDAMD